MNEESLRKRKGQRRLENGESEEEERKDEEGKRRV